MAEALANAFPSSGLKPPAACSDDLHPSTLSSRPITISPSALVHSDLLVSDKLYSGFVEHVGRCIYGGIVDSPKDPSPEHLLHPPETKGLDGEGKTKPLGWRKDIIKILGRKGELEMPILRWPGGNFVSNYHWQDAIGPLEDRPVRMELAWRSTESNLFGTDEFIQYCRELGAEPYFCVNMGTGTYEEALAWLEYCNGTGDTYWANLRRRNTGRDEPHNVKYWGLGNEMHGPWQVGHLSATAYTTLASRWAHGLKIVDPTIKLVSCGNTGNAEWDREVLMGLIDIIDYHSIHFYSMLGHNILTAPGHEYEKNVFGPTAAERSIEICTGLIDMAKLAKGSVWEFGNEGPKNVEVSTKDVTICFDEWNVWDEQKAPGRNGLEQIYDYTDMLAVCAWLNILVRKHKEVGIACIAQSCNVISPVMTKPDGILLQVTYYPLRLFAKYMKGGHLLNLGYTPDTYNGPTFPSWIAHLHKPAYIDACAILVKNENGSDSIRLAVLNRHPTVDWKGDLRFLDFEVESVEIHTMYSEDLNAKNTWEKPDLLVPKIEKLSGPDWEKNSSYPIQKHSWSFFIFEGKAQ